LYFPEHDSYIDNYGPQGHKKEFENIAVGAKFYLDIEILSTYNTSAISLSYDLIDLNEVNVEVDGRMVSVPGMTFARDPDKTNPYCYTIETSHYTNKDDFVKNAKLRFRIQNKNGERECYLKYISLYQEAFDSKGELITPQRLISDNNTQTPVSLGQTNHIYKMFLYDED
jgi:hypothetical protein